MRNYVLNGTRLCRSQAIIIKDNAIMMLRQSGKKTKEDFWVLPGGSNHRNENFDETMLRELKEEINVDVENYNLLDVFATNDDEYYLFTTYLVDLKEDDNPSPGVESVATQILNIEWLSIEDIMNDKHDDKFTMTKPNIKQLLNMAKKLNSDAINDNDPQEEFA